MKLTKLSLFLFSCLFSVHCMAENDKATTCEKWLAKAVKDVESVPPQKRFIRSLEQLKIACEQAIPKKLKQAATDALATKNPQQRFTILLNSTAEYFPSICYDIEIKKPASYLESVCKGDDATEGIYTDVLPFLEASSYLYGKAIEKELKKATLKTQIRDTPKNNLHINKILLNYFLGAQLDYSDRKPKY